MVVQANYGGELESPGVENEDNVSFVDAQSVKTGIMEDSKILLYYSTGWQRASLHYSLCGGEWKDLPFSKVVSSSHWHQASLEVRGNHNGSKILEFVVTDAEGAWDKPQSGGNYSISTTGTFAVRHGKVEIVNERPLMIVSDLDGTMIGDDSGTRAFKDFWQDKAILGGSILVYNSGRSLQSFLALLEEKSHCLNIPDVFISAVGTQIYLNDGVGNWQEDKGWTGTLQKDWDLDKVREAAYSALGDVGKDAMHFRPPDEQNDFKVTCGVAFAVLEKVVSQIQASLEASGVKARIISSGLGEWRFLDIVSYQAGKLEALEHIRKLYGFSMDETIACGDSGNDILMLSGENPAIVVGNAQPDLIHWVESEQASSGSSRLFVSSRNEAYGILDGIRHFGYSV